MSEWSILTNHANVLISVTEEPDIRLKDLAGKLGISERAVKRIVADLEHAGFISRERKGRDLSNLIFLLLTPALLFRMYSTLNQSLGKPKLVTWLQLGALLSALLPVLASL